MSMDPERKAEWLAALRSGNYRQTTNKLTDDSGAYCCLGVACHLAVEAGVISKWVGPDYTYFGDLEYRGFPYGSQNTVKVFSWSELPVQVQEWMGLVSPDPVVELPEDHPALPELRQSDVLYDSEYDARLSQLNDTARLTFEQIADLIEDQL